MSRGLTYNVDIVMCIDCTGSMGDLLDTVKKMRSNSILTSKRVAMLREKKFQTSAFA